MLGHFLPRTSSTIRWHTHARQQSASWSRDTDSQLATRRRGVGYRHSLIVNVCRWPQGNWDMGIASGKRTNSNAYLIGFLSSRALVQGPIYFERQSDCVVCPLSSASCSHSQDRMGMEGWWLRTDGGEGRKDLREHWSVAAARFEVWGGCIWYQFIFIETKATPFALSFLALIIILCCLIKAKLNSTCVRI